MPRRSASGSTATIESTRALRFFSVWGQNHSVMNMVALAAAKAGKEPTIVHHPAHPADVQQSLADPRKSQNLLASLIFTRSLVDDPILQNGHL